MINVVIDCMYGQGENITGPHLTNNTKIIIVTSSMGNVDLLPKEKETVLQNLPQVSRGPIVDAYLQHKGILRILRADRRKTLKED